MNEGILFDVAMTAGLFVLVVILYQIYSSERDAAQVTIAKAK